ncbi:MULTISPECIES: hypothetical protein [Xenorhabdus]|uniref:hypothetical protein n=1 Tax=Xenorhabdus TaxID=626 RepID=UPI00068C0E09|nr:MULTISPECIES: hypothetical protein [Xenorhabdus]
MGSASKNTLTLFDRGFLSAELFQTWQGTGKNTHRKMHPHLEKTWRARLILIPEPNGEIKGFITSLECPVTLSPQSS